MQFFLSPPVGGSSYSITELYGPNAPNIFSDGIKIKINNYSSQNTLKAICKSKLYVTKINNEYELKFELVEKIEVPGFENISAFIYSGVRNLTDDFKEAAYNNLKRPQKVMLSAKLIIDSDKYFDAIVADDNSFYDLNPWDEIWPPPLIGGIIAIPSEEITFRIETTRVKREFTFNGSVVKFNNMDPLFFWNEIIGNNSFTISEQDKTLINNTLLNNNLQRGIIELRDEFNCPIKSDSSNDLFELTTDATLHFRKSEGTTSTMIRGTELVRGAVVVEGAATANIKISGKKSTGDLLNTEDDKFFFQERINQKNTSIEVDLMFTPPNHMIVYVFEPADWFAEQDVDINEFTSVYPTVQPVGRRVLRRYTEGNKADYLIDGFEYFADLSNAISNLNVGNNNQFIHIAGWAFYRNLVLRDLTSNFNGTTYNNNYGPAYQNLVINNRNNILLTLLNIYKNNLVILFYDPDTLFYNEDAEADGLAMALNGWNIPNRWLRDDKVSNNGAIHMKVITIKNANNLVGYCGGMDLWPNRLTDGSHEFARDEEWAEHDVTIKVEGLAANELDLVLYQRWADNKRGNLRSDDPFSAPSDVSAMTTGKHIIQVARTTPENAQMADGPNEYSFAKNGDYTIWNTIEMAVMNARHYIYIEDQYFNSDALIPLLTTAIGRVEFVIIVIPRSNWENNIPSEPDAHQQLTAIRDRVGVQDFDAKVRICFLEVAVEKNIYVHSKLQIIDDIFVSCGSANLDSRGLGVKLDNNSNSIRSSTCSQECNVMIIDEKVDASGAREFAKNLRTKLWAEHLGLKTSDPYLQDPLIAFNKYWRSRNPTHHVRFLQIDGV